jgi:hypothetical protein
MDKLPQQLYHLGSRPIKHLLAQCRRLHRWTTLLLHHHQATFRRHLHLVLR